MYNISLTLGSNILETKQGNYFKLSGTLEHILLKLPSKFQLLTSCYTRDMESQSAWIPNGIHKSARSNYS